MSWMPPSTMYFSTIGESSRNRSYCSLRAETHHVLDAGAVVPTAVENHDFAGCREVRHVPLKVDLRFLAVGRRRQRDQPKHTRADTLGDGFDRPTLTRSIPSFEKNDNTESLVLDPLLKLTELCLKVAQFLLVRLPIESFGTFGLFHILPLNVNLD